MSLLRRVRILKREKQRNDIDQESALRSYVAAVLALHLRQRLTVAL